MVLLMLLVAMPQTLPVQALAADGPVGAPAQTAASAQLPGSGVIDYAGGYSSSAPARFKRAGVGIVVRYVGASRWKCLTRRESDALRRAGIDIAAVYETSARWMFGGRKAGVAAAKKARAAVIACGGPRTPFVYFACDTPTRRYSTVNACLRGAASVLGADHVGIYGSYSVCKNALKSGSASKAWQTLAWSSGKVLPGAALYQSTHRVFGSLGVGYDTNFVRADDVGQWGYAGPGTVSWAIQSVPTTAGLTSVDFASVGLGCAVGDGGTVIRTADGGVTWTAQSTPTTATLRSVRFADASSGWAVGDGGTVIRTADGGVMWTAQSTPTTATLRSVRFADASNGWAVGDAGTVIRTTDGGASWIAQSVPATAALTAVDFANSTNGWVVGGGGTVIRTTDGGATWTLRSTPTTVGLTAVDFANSTNGWAVGERGTLLRTRNGGSTWTAQSAPTTATLTAVHFIDDKTGWAVGDSSTALRTADGGATWTAHYVPTPAALSSIKFTGPTTGWAVGSSGTVMRATVSWASPFGTIAGVVTNAVTGAPVAGIGISIGSRLAAPSAVDGTFVAARLKPGTYGVRFSNSRYITQSAQGIAVPAGLRTTVSGRLKPRIVTALTRPSVVPTMPLGGQVVTLTVTISPASAATAAVTTVYGSHYEQKTVKKKVKGKTKKVKVWYWRSRITLRMSAETPGTLVAPVALASGKWRVHARFRGSGKYLPSTSKTTHFDVN